MRTGIATVSLSGLLADKLPAIAAAGFDGIEVFDNDLVASPLSPHEVAARCADLGLAIDLFQPVRDVEGVPPERFPEVLRRVRTKLRVMEELGATTFLACSNATRDALPDRDLSAEQLHEIGSLAAEHGVSVAWSSEPTIPPSASRSTRSTCWRAATTVRRSTGSPRTGSASFRSPTPHCST
jgi:4-hydroxyphenylpyruvate dioxygenase